MDNHVFVGGHPSYVLSFFGKKQDRSNILR
jgi:hypothetical protein